MVASVVLLVISLVPAFPTIPFLAVALLIGSAGYLLKQNEKEQLLIATEIENIPVNPHKEGEKDEFKVSQVEPIALEIGYGLIPLVDESREENLVNQITAIRRQCSNELGIIVNSIRIRDNLQLPPNDYVIKIKGNIVARGNIYLNKYMVLDPGNGEFNLEGIPTKEPAFGIDALWIDENQKDKAELEGYTVVEPSTILVTHLKEVIKNIATNY
jgi:Flagellar biosynthesis pathway, component FlhA